jgi:Fe-S-cluster containining protein
LSGHVPECTGACCAAFVLNAGALKDLNSGKAYDADFILAMLIPLSPEEVLERTERFSLRWAKTAPFALEFDAEGATQFFSCQHWNEETKLCGSYENRPRMCSKYPADGDLCCHCGGRLRGRRPEGSPS